MKYMETGSYTFMLVFQENIRFEATLAIAMISQRFYSYLFKIIVKDTFQVIF